jgi:hypothetical protein
MNNFIVDCRKQNNGKYGFHREKNNKINNKPNKNFNKNKFYEKNVNQKPYQDFSGYEILTNKKSLNPEIIKYLEEYIKNVLEMYLYNNCFCFKSLSYDFYEKCDILFSYNGYNIAYTDCVFNYVKKQTNVNRYNIFSKLNHKKNWLTCFNIEAFKRDNMLSFRSGDTISLLINYINKNGNQNDIHERYDELYTRNVEIPLHFLHNKLKPCFVCHKMCHTREIVFDCECGIHYGCSNGINHCHDCVKSKHLIDK